MKKRMVYQILAVTAAGCLALSAAGCGQAETEVIVETLADEGAVSGPADTASTAAISIADAEELFTDRDLSGAYNPEECEKIELTDGSVTISEEGTYLLTGSLEEGMILVDADESAKVQLVLDGVSVSNSEGAAIYIRQADKVFITLASGSVNTLSNGGAYTAIDDNNIDGVIFSKCDLTINGEGSLTVTAQAGHGIVSKDDLKITGGSVTVTAEKHGLSGKDSVCVAAGTLNITSGKDGIHSENADKKEKGYVYIGDGSLTVESQGDCISAGIWLQIDGGVFQLTAGDGSGNDTVAKDETGEAVSTKGIKAGGQLVVNAGTFHIDSQDDALHSNDSLTVNGGEFLISTGDDGLHADAAATVNGGTIDIALCYEGIEGQQVVISGGDIALSASDDGINAAGGNDGSGFGGRFGGDFGGFGGAADSDSSVLISGGRLFVNADGDGIDSNGTLTVTGGEIYVSGPESGADGAIDYEGQGQITGGIVVALGNAQMAMNFGDTSTQGSVLTNNIRGEAGTEIVLKDSAGEVLVSYTAEKAFQSAVVSCPGLVQGGTYTLSAGSTGAEITLESLIYGNGSGMGGFGGQGGRGGAGDRGGRGQDGEAPEGEMPEMPGNGELPEDGRPGATGDGGRPQMPTDGEMPQMPGNGELPEGGMPGATGDGGRPQMPTDGEMPQMPGNGELPEGDTAGNSM